LAVAPEEEAEEKKKKKLVNTICTGWHTQKEPGLGVNVNKRFITNKRRASVILYLKSYFVIYKKAR
jgi:hypothetical protein